MSLKLSGYEGDSFHIGDNVAVTISRVMGSKVRLEFIAPPEVKILRDVLFQRDHAETPNGPAPAVHSMIACKSYQHADAMLAERERKAESEAANVRS